MQKVNGNSIFYTHDNKVIYYKEKGQSIEEDVTVIEGKDAMYCRNISTNNFYKVNIIFEYGRAVLFRIHTINYTKNEFFENFNLVTESYYNLNTGTKPHSINNEIGNYRFWKNIYTEEVLICDKKFIVQCGPSKGLDIRNISGHKMVNIPTKIGCTITGKLVSKKVAISIKDGKLTIEWRTEDSNELFNDLDLFRLHYFFIDDEDFVEEELEAVDKKTQYPLTEKESFKSKVEKDNTLGIGNYSFWSDGNQVIVAKHYKAIHGIISGLDVRDSFTLRKMPVPTIISPSYNVNVRLFNFQLSQVGGELYIRVNDITFGRESTVEAFLNDGGKFIYKELETKTFNGLGNYKQKLTTLNDNPKYRDYMNVGSNAQDYIDRLLNVDPPRVVLPDWLNTPLIYLDWDGKIRIKNGVKDENKKNVELKLIELEDEEDLMNEQVFKMRVIN